MPVKQTLGIRLKDRRTRLGMSLRELARRTDLTASFLSQVERAKANVSLDSLKRISDILDVPLLYFLSDSQPTPPENTELPIETDEAEPSDTLTYSPVVRSNERPKLILPLSGVEYELLNPDLGRKMEAFCGSLSPGAGNVAKRLREPTEEFIYVLAGALLIGLDSGEHILYPGDSIYIDGQSLQKLTCASENEDARWISVITPPVF